MIDSHAPVEGWYDDPHLAMRLRWWDGARWTHHHRPKAVVEITRSSIVAEPTLTEPYGYSAPYSWSPHSPASFDLPAAASTAAVLHHRELGTTSATVIDYTPERTTTPAAWALAVTPVVTVLAETAAAVLSGFESTPLMWIIGATIIPILWIIVWVRRDRLTLYEWGHLRRAHWGWAFLGALGYLVARMIVVRRQSRGHGWWPLTVNLAITAVLVNVGIFTPVLGVLGTTLF